MFESLFRLFSENGINERCYLADKLVNLRCGAFSRLARDLNISLQRR